MFGIGRCSPARAPCRYNSPHSSQVILNDDNLTDLQAEYEGPGGRQLHGSGLPDCNFAAKPLGVRRLARFCPAHPAGRPPPPRLHAAGTPYEGGLFRMRLTIGPEFPNAPPKGAQTCDRVWQCCTGWDASSRKTCPHGPGPAPSPLRHPAGPTPCRLLHDQDFPPQRQQLGGHLRQRAEAGLEARPGPAPRAHSHPLPAH